MSINEKMTAIAEAIRQKTGETGLLNLDQMAQKINTLSSDDAPDTSDATAAAEDIVSPATAYVKGEKISGALVSSAIDFTVGKANIGVDSDDNLYFKIPNSGTTGKRRLVDSGQSITLKQPISTFGDAKASDVSKGKTFTSAAGFLVEGTQTNTDTSDATATAEDLAEGKTAYVNGEKLEGSLPVKNSINIGGVYASVSESSSTFQGSGTYEGPAIVKNTAVTVHMSKSAFGDATAADVAKGKTFTSSAGLKVTGTREESNGIDTSDATATAEDLAEGKTAYVNGEKLEGSLSVKSSINIGAVYASVSESSSTIQASGTYEGPVIVKNTAISVNVSKSAFGDATAADVAKGKTFTSSAGLKVTGTMEGTSGGSGTETFHITSVDDVITPTVSGTVKIYGYGYYSSGSYSKTNHCFVGDGYYTPSSSSFGSSSTPSKTSATFSIGTNGKLSGLPISSYTTLDLLVTVGEE